jgi:hypothetical protein
MEFDFSGHCSHPGMADQVFIGDLFTSVCEKREPVFPHTQYPVTYRQGFQLFAANTVAEHGFTDDAVKTKI